MGRYVTLAMLALTLTLTLACDENVTRAPKPVEQDEQFVILREMRIGGDLKVRVVRDKVSGKELYITPGAGVWVKED